MMEFRTKYKRVENFSKPGTPIRYLYGTKLDKEKNLIIEKKGQENFYSYINSFADSVDINVLLARFSNGDKEALLQRAGHFLDVSQVPTNINEFMDYQRNMQAYFDTLPIQVKKQYDNNVLKFMSQVNEPNWIDILKNSTDDLNKEMANKAKEVSNAHKKNIKIDEVVENPGVDVVTEEGVKK